MTIKAIVRGTKYDREEQGFFSFTYIGERKKVLLRILDEHSYGAEEDDSEEDLIESLKGSNGDGCDEIYFFQLGDDVIIDDIASEEIVVE